VGLIPEVKVWFILQFREEDIPEDKVNISKIDFIV
jgi:hypothetical protein